jgi:hypothetical protein
MIADESEADSPEPEHDPFKELYNYKPMTEEERARISAALRARGALKRCPQCDGDKWGGPSYSFTPMESEPDKRGFLGPYTGTVTVLCFNCGFVSEHALHILGLLPDREPKKPQDAAREGK